MRETILSLTALLISLTSFAGKSWTLIFSAPYTIEKSCYDNLQVIDMRTYKDDVGFVKRGNARSRVALVTANPLSDELSAYFFNALPERPKEKKELVLVLHDLWVEDDPWLYSASTVHFDGDFYCNDNGQYIFLSRLDTLTENFHGHDYYTGGGRQDLAINRTVQALISTVFSKYAVTLPRPGIAHVSKSQMIQRRADERSRYPIFHTDTFRKGIYYSIDQFLNGKPVDTAINIVAYEGAKNTATSYKIYYASDDGKPAVPLEKGNYFAVYDGKMWFAGQTDATDMLNGYADSMNYQNGNFYRVEYLKGIKSELKAPVTLLLGVMVTAEKYVKLQYVTKFDPESGSFIPIGRYYHSNGLTMFGSQ